MRSCWSSPRCSPAAGPLELPRLLRAFDHDGDEALGLSMVAALERSKRAREPAGRRAAAAAGEIPGVGPGTGEALLASLNVDAANRRSGSESLLESLAGGDVRRGQVVFNSQKAACVTCHAIGYIGGRIGPDLTRIGQVRSERDLLEAILFPSASFARSYEPVIVTTTSGDIHSGVLRSEAARRGRARHRRRRRKSRIARQTSRICSPAPSR